MVIPAVKRDMAIVFWGAMAAAKVRVTECKSCVCVSRYQYTNEITTRNWSGKWWNWDRD
jgi:hypothetical protein